MVVVTRRKLSAPMLELSDEEKVPKSWRVAEGSHALAEASRRLGLPYSRDHVRSLVEAQKNATSMLAVVETAKALGLEVTTGEIQVESLESPEPGVVLCCGLGSRGFGLIESVGATEVKLWDSVYKSRSLTRPQFTREFSGVLAVIELPELHRPPHPEPGRLGRRLVERLFEELRIRTDLVGPASAPGAPRVLLGLVAALLALGAVRASPVTVAVLGGLAAVGLGLSYAMIRSVYGGSESVNFLCGGAHSGCNDLLHSRFARVAGIPASGLGVAFFSAQVMVLGCFPTGAYLTGCLSLAVLPEAALFFWVMVQNRMFCRLCAVVHAVNLASGVYFLFVVSRHLPPLFEVTLVGVAWLLVFGLVLSGVVPHLIGADRAGVFQAELEQLRESPWWLGRQLAEAKQVSFDAQAVTVSVTRSPGGYDLSVIANLDCLTCALLMKSLDAWLAEEKGRGLCVRVGFAMSARPGLAEAIMAVGLATKGERLFEAYRWAKADPARLDLKTDAFADVADAMGLPVDELERYREIAQRQVAEVPGECAQAVGAKDYCPYPLVLFAGRRLESSLNVIRKLINESPELLQLALRQASPTADNEANATERAS